MSANTPWCPRCGDWRGYAASLCAGCSKVEEMLLQLPGTTTDPKTKLTVPTADATPEMKVAIKTARVTMTGQRFTFISEKRTEREAYTQALEQFVDDRVDTMKTIAFEWGALRKEAAQFRFSQMYAWELMSAMELALTDLSAVSLELSNYDKNKPAHDERMKRVIAWMEVLSKFRNPEASEAPPVEPDVADETPGEDE
jgi:hypothetical protein